ncbi:MAG TPA: ATP-binding protein [Candidatus Binatia bacterium]|nr:ATP-binding protein [Candidatus Binatia bacterium]
MLFRRKLLVMLSLTVFLSVGAVALLVLTVTRRAFDRSENERTAALVTQFRREFNHQGEDVARRVEAVAATEAVIRMAAALGRTPADTGPYFELAKTLAENRQLDFLEFVESDGTIISSAELPARFGYHEDGLNALRAAAGTSAFLKRENLQDTPSLGLFAVRAAQADGQPIYIAGGRRVDKSFLAGLDAPVGTRVLLYENRGSHFTPESLLGLSDESAKSAALLQPLIDSVRQSHRESTARVDWSDDRANEEEFYAVPLEGVSTATNHDLLAILLIGNSRRAYVGLVRHIEWAALLTAGGGILLAILLSGWAAARFTRPVENLAGAAREVAAGNWDTRVDVLGYDELGQLADSFNRMTTELLNQRDRLLQAERVAAWRELARRLAHELKNPMFPLQLTVETMLRAKQQNPEQFDELFRESARTLLAEISNLKGIVDRFSEFSRMPQPRLELVQINDVVRGAVQTYQAQLSCNGESSSKAASNAAKINCEMQLDPQLQMAMLDSDLLHRAISNLVLNGIEAMPEGGVLTLRTRQESGKIAIEITDTGAGLTAEECEKIFTPYYTSKKNGTGLGLAIVQSVVSDHGGTIRVQSEKGRGTTFVIELPAVSGV